MKVNLKLSPNMKGKGRFLLSDVFCCEMFSKSNSPKLIRKWSTLGVRVAKVGLLREPFRILLFVLDLLSCNEVYMKFLLRLMFFPQ